MRDKWNEKKTIKCDIFVSNYVKNVALSGNDESKAREAKRQSVSPMEDSPTFPRHAVSHIERRIRVAVRKIVHARTRGRA